MSTLATLVADLQARGVTLEPRGDKLRVRPVSKLNSEDLEMLKVYKTEIMAMLAAPSSPAPSTLPERWPATLAGFGSRRTVQYSQCEMCLVAPFPAETITIAGVELQVPAPQGTWVSYGRVPLCWRHARQVAGTSR